MPNVLTQKGDVGCGHGGNVLVSSTAKLRVNGAPALLKASIEGQAVDAGAHKCLTPVSQMSKPCTSVSKVTTGKATKLTVGGAPVVLDATLHGQTDGEVGGVTPQLLLYGAAKQTKLTAI